MRTSENPKTVHRFILQAIDPILGCPVLAAMVRVADLDTLRPLLGEDALDDPELQDNHELTFEQLQAITDSFGVAFDPGGRECWLSRVHWIGDTPYLVHTGYELALMLDGIRSPSGRVYDGVRRVYYARPGEEWRIDAHLLLWRQLEHGPWNDTLERLEGSLLGYTDAQNDWWLARRRKDHATSTRSDWTVYIAVDAAELAWIRAIGERAFNPERSDAILELVMHWPRPEPAILEDWLVESGAAAILRVGLPRNFLTGREFGHRNGARSYLIKPGEVLALNRALTSSIEVIYVRQETPLAE